MLKFAAAICALGLLASAACQEYDEMTHEEIMSESQRCGESNFHEGNCMQKANCVFVHWRLKNLGEKLRLCMSYNEVMKYFVKEPQEYLRRVGAKNHRTINRSNFCDVMDDRAFLGHDGVIEKCRLSTV